MKEKEFSEEKLTEYEKILYKKFSRLKNKKTLSVVAPVAVLVIYIIFIRLFFSWPAICLAQEEQGLDIIIMGFNLGKSASEAIGILSVACLGAAFISGVIATVMLNIVFNSVNKVRKIRTDITVERIKILLKEADKYTGKIGVFEVKVKNQPLIKLMLTSGAVIFAVAVFLITKEAIVMIIALAMYGIFICIPALVVCKVIDKINSAFAGEISNEIYNTLDKWWLELDPEEKERREAEIKAAKLAREASKDRLLSLYAKAMVREKAEADAHSAAMKEWERWV